MISMPATDSGMQVFIELTRACNFACNFCPHPCIARPTGVMSLANPRWDVNEDRLVDSKVGSYFSLPGSGMDATGTGSDVADRGGYEFIVVRQFVALEGTAARIKPQYAKQKGFTLGGVHGSPGGGTQVFIPEDQLACLGAAHEIDTLAGKISGDRSTPEHESLSQQGNREMPQDDTLPIRQTTPATKDGKDEFSSGRGACWTLVFTNSALRNSSLAARARTTRSDSRKRLPRVISSQINWWQPQTAGETTAALALQTVRELTSAHLQAREKIPEHPLGKVLLIHCMPSKECASGGFWPPASTEPGETVPEKISLARLFCLA